jgi:hypothetical protein
MKRIFICRLAVVAMLVLIFHAGLMAATSPPQEGGVLPEIDLPVPKDLAHRDYLGLAGDDPFQIPQIKAEVVIIEIFSMY